jgi:hypothetical protein
MASIIRAKSDFITVMIEAVSTSEILVNFLEATQQNIPEGNYLLLLYYCKLRVYVFILG